MFSGKRIKWEHFGKKYQLKFSDYEIEKADLCIVLYKKAHQARPDLDGELAYIDQYGRQIILSTDKEVRDALAQSKGKLKVHTTLREGAVISAAEMAGRPARSYSLPPDNYVSYPPTNNSRPPSSMDSTGSTYHHQQHHRNVISPQPSAYSPGREVIRTTYSAHAAHSGGYSGMSPYGYKYGPYSQNLLYGMPPHNGMLLRFLANPFPYSGYGGRSFIGPNKYHNFGAYGGSAFGPFW